MALRTRATVPVPGVSGVSIGARPRSRRAVRPGDQGRKETTEGHRKPSGGISFGSLRKLRTEVEEALVRGPAMALLHRKRFPFRLFDSTCPSSAQVSLESIVENFRARLPRASKALPMAFWVTPQQLRRMARFSRRTCSTSAIARARALSVIVLIWSDSRPTTSNRCASEQANLRMASVWRRRRCGTGPLLV